MTTTPTLDTLDRLQAALDDFARSLTTGRADAVLAAEEPLAAAALALARLAPGESTDRLRLRRAIHRASLSLARCRALGQSATDLARSMTATSVYGRSGQQVVPFTSTMSSRP